MEFSEELNGIVCGLEPERLVNQPERCGIIGLFKLHMAIAMDLYLGPGCQLGGDIEWGSSLLLTVTLLYGNWIL